MAEIGINLRADPSQFQAGTKAAQKAMDDWERAAVEGADDVADKLEEVIRTLVKLGTESGKTRDDIVGDLRKFGLSAEQAERAIDAVWEEMGDGQKAARDVERAAEAFSGVEKNAGQAADATKRVGDATDETGSRFSELGDIARDVLEGDFSGAAESAIGALGALGAFAGAGGALAGLLGAGVATMVDAWIGQWERAKEATKERMSSMYEDMLESGKAYLSDQFVATRIAEIYDPKNVEEFNQAVTIANQLGVERSVVIQAMAGSEEAHLTVTEAARTRLEELVAKQREHIATTGEESLTLATQIAETERGITAYDRYAGAEETAAAKAREAAGAINDAGGAAQTAAGKIDGVALALRTMPDGKTIKVDADTAAYWAEIEAIRRQKISVTVGIDALYQQRRGTQTE